ncbi:MAG: TatD family hydrolase [Oscillospiraceae bacterium]|jgi:TatD DNase family protein|nr:TatD family hydrolase [Oscillospiraceae bacterium]
MFFDTHAHYDDKRFDGDRDEVLGAMESAGVSLIVNAGSSMESSAAGLALADRFPFVYATVGVHPHDSKEMDDGSVDVLQELLRHPKAVAVGEIGLDYHYDFSPRDVQMTRFREQLELARFAGMPVVIHEREALRDTLDTIREFRDLSGVLHCFSGSWETARIILDMGWYLSFTGVITFKNARKALDVVAKVPADRIMIETDCPYLSPEPVRGRRNSSLFLAHIAQKVAEVRGITVEDAAALTMENGKRFFGLRM